MKPAAFFFDLDGTLIDSEPAWARAIVLWLAEKGATATVADIAPLVSGHSWPDIDATLHAAYPVLGKATMEDDAQFLRVCYGRVVKDPTEQIIRPTVDFLREAARVAPCAIVSGSPHADVQRAAELCGVADLLSAVLGAEDYARGKPFPDSYLAAAAKLGVAPEACIVVEDSTPGVRSGLAAGMRVIGLDRSLFVKQDFTGCAWRVKALDELNPCALDC